MKTKRHFAGLPEIAGIAWPVSKHVDVALLKLESLINWAITLRGLFPKWEIRKLNGPVLISTEKWINLQSKPTTSKPKTEKLTGNLT